MKIVVAFVVAVAALLHVEAVYACGNAVFLEDDAIRRVRDAQVALDEGDVERARGLAAEVAHSAAPANALLRADRIVAVSWIRDRGASSEEIERAVETLRALADVHQVGDPTLSADYGEALARAGRDDDAYARLSPLAEKDLIGSPYAYAALARVSERRGDGATAGLARARCASISADPGVCRGEYPRAPLLRGTPMGYALPGALALVALALRVLSRRRGAPWLGHHDTIFALLVVLTGAAAFSLARAPWAAACFSTVALAIVARVQRGLFLRAVERERVPGFALRPATSEDGRVPALRSLFTSSERVLEETPDAAYREPARVAVLRLVPRSRTAVVLVAVTLAVLALTASCAALTLRAA